jgi:hypothetical protein
MSFGEKWFLLKELNCYCFNGDVAASGGYYIACVRIPLWRCHNYSDPIGVFGMIPNAKKLLNEKVGYL